MPKHDKEKTIEQIIGRGVTEVIDKENIRKRLLSGKKLRIKYGADPTRPDLHLGHAVGMKKLKMLQDLGHDIIFIIGDFTTKIGDPSGKSKTRPMLTDEEIEKNAKTYFDQVGKILDVEKVKIVHNSDWFSKMTFVDLLNVASKFTLQRMIERDDFTKRLKKGTDIGLQEILYPLMQAYDSVHLEADIELAGYDQRLNVLAGRELQKKMGQTPQDLILVPLLVGLDGKEKMSKSLDNYIGVAEDANSMFGKVMSIPDSLILNYYELCTEVGDEELKDIKEQLKDKEVNPRDLKMELAEIIAADYHGEAEAKKAKENFINTFSKKEIPKTARAVPSPALNIPLIDYILETGAAKSKSEARRKIEQGGVCLNGEKILDINFRLDSEEHDGIILKIGKHNFVKVKFE